MAMCNVKCEECVNLKLSFSEQNAHQKFVKPLTQRYWQSNGAEGCSLQAVLAQSAEKEESSQRTQPSSAA